MAKLLPSPSVVVLAFGLMHVVVAVVFLKGFLLTRVELPDVAAASSAPSNGLKPYSKAVVLIVDALRHDFLCAQPGGQANHLSAGLMPRTLGLVNAAAGAALAARFIADTPTITMSRLKAILTGGLPTFLDVGQSFSASALTEDNLLLQLQAQQKRMVVMGDDTWMQLAQDVFTEAYPYPSFDVHDLHTVDDGVAEHLLPLLARPDSWDVLLAHYLGVDHAGHTHGVNSRQMAAKLAQMDEQVSRVIETLVAQAGPGGAYEDALLLVLSDHGQTLGGDHGGGSPAETDSVVVAMSLARAYAALEQAAGGNSSSSSSFELVQRLAAAGGYLDSSPASLAAAAAAAASEACAGGQRQCRRPEETSFWLCGTQMSQIDLTPTLAQALGVAIPFGNLGRLPPQLYWVLARPADSPRISDYSAALQRNAEQVHSYLNRYAAIGGLPAAQLASINKMFRQLQGRLEPTGAEPREREGGATESRVLAQLAFLAAAADLARKRFTLFQQGPMWAGCGLGVVVLAVQLLYCWHAVRGLHRAEAPQAATTSGSSNVSAILFTCLAAFHALGLFSVGLLMGEGRLQCVLLAAVTLLLARATLASVLAARSASRTLQPASRVVCGTPGAAVNGHAPSGNGPHLPRQATTLQWWHGPWPAVGAAGAAFALLACNVALQALGLIDRAGQDPHDKTQPSADLLVGPGAAWQRTLYCAATLGPLAALWALTRRCSSGRGWSCVAAAQPGPGAVERPGSAGCVVVWLCQGLAGVQFVALCVFWVAQLTGSAEESVASVAELLWQQLLARHLPWLQAAIASVPGLRVCASAGVARAVFGMPLRLLLPQLVYSAALLAVGVVVLFGLARALLRRLGHRRHPKQQLCQSSSAEPGAAWQLWVWLCAVLAAPLVAVLGYKGPATMLLAVLQAVCVAYQLHLHQAAAFSYAAAGAADAATAGDQAVPATATCGRQLSGVESQAAAQSQQKGCQLPPAPGESLGPVVGAGTWSMMSLQLFFCSGHFCEFSGLQYASAFIGIDSMVWYVSGSLLLLNTCGFFMLGCVSLPLLLMALGGAGGERLREQLTCSMSVMNSMRCAALVVCMISAAVQQQHILLWAIFAPKLVFELWFMAVVDVTQLFVCTLADLWLR